MSMNGRHRAPPRFPFVAVVVAIVVVAGVVVGARAVLPHGDNGKPSAHGSTGSAPSGPFVFGSPPATTTGSGGTTSAPGGSTSKPGGTTSSPSPAQPKGALVIHGAGDTNVDSGYIGVSPSNYDTLLSGMNGLFVHDDLTVVNLECSVTKLGTPVPKEFNFHGDPAALPYLKRGGVDVANMANNHSYDYGPEALVDTGRTSRRPGSARSGPGRIRPRPRSRRSTT